MLRRTRTRLLARNLPNPHSRNIRRHIITHSRMALIPTRNPKRLRNSRNMGTGNGTGNHLHLPHRRLRPRTPIIPLRLNPHNHPRRPHSIRCIHTHPHHILRTLPPTHHHLLIRPRLRPHTPPARPLHRLHHDNPRSHSHSPHHQNDRNNAPHLTHLHATNDSRNTHLTLSPHDTHLHSSIPDGRNHRPIHILRPLSPRLSHNRTHPHPHLHHRTPHQKIIPPQPHLDNPQKNITFAHPKRLKQNQHRHVTKTIRIQPRQTQPAHRNHSRNHHIPHNGLHPRRQPQHPLRNRNGQRRTIHHHSSNLSSHNPAHGPLRQTPLRTRTRNGTQRILRLHSLPHTRILMAIRPHSSIHRRTHIHPPHTHQHTRKNSLPHPRHTQKRHISRNRTLHSIHRTPKRRNHRQLRRHTRLIGQPYKRIRNARNHRNHPHINPARTQRQRSTPDRNPRHHHHRNPTRSHTLQRHLLNTPLNITHILQIRMG